MSRPLSTFPLAPSTKKMLANNCFEVQSDIIGMKPLALAKELGIKPQEALKIIRIVSATSEQKRGGGSDGSAISSSQSALQMLAQKKSLKPIFTSCRALDNMLGGGIQMCELTEFCGLPGIGKTQLGMQIACNTVLPPAINGVDGDVVYIDTEGSLMPERLQEIAEALVQRVHRVKQGEIDKCIRRQQQNNISNATNTAHTIIDPQTRALVDALNPFTVEYLMQSIHVYRIYDYVEQLSCMASLPAFLDQHPRVKVVILDSVAFHFRRGFDDMALRSRLLTGMAQTLLSIAEKYKLAVVVTNQVTTKFNRPSFNNNHIAHNSNNHQRGGGNKTEQHKSNARIAPALGQSWAHACTHRVMLHWSEHDEVSANVSSVRSATILKSPSCKPDTIQYVVTKSGIKDVNGGRPRASTQGSRKRAPVNSYNNAENQHHQNHQKQQQQQQRQNLKRPRNGDYQQE